LNQPTPEALRVADSARTIALQMLEERGRGAVLVGVARVDTAIEHLLQAVMTPGDDRRDNLFQPDRPLGSLGAKVSLAHRLGLIDAPVEKSLHALRKLRNDFAHSAGSASLADPSHRSKLEIAYAHARLNSLWGPLEAALSSQPESSQGALDPCLRDYILLITILVAFLEATAQQLSPLAPPVLMSFGGIINHHPKQPT
jgi:hypothetical protein